MANFTAGEVYRTLKKVEAICLYTYTAPFTGGGDVVLPMDLEFQVMLDPPQGATAISANPLDYDRYHDQLVPPEIRADSQYSGYGLVIDFSLVEKHCELVTGAT